ncbi:MAG: CAAX prenyl protease-related protein [Acidobacteriia bacterium]|nr:CAAX prenyl protease-related protein [Terriglobia bacterium]
MPRHPTLAYVAPFAVYVGLLAVQRWIPLPVPALHSLRFAIVLGVIAVVSRPVLSLRPSVPIASIGVGIAVFLIWIGPDLLFGYRHSAPFENALTGHAVSTLPANLRQDRFFLALRLLTTAGLVPILEELFWRGWMMRWLMQSKDFWKVPLGAYQPFAFWTVAVLFASEHGPYWEVGLLAGIVYNWWLIRTKNLADCILAHAVTNGILAIYVLAAGQWQYWL